MLELMDTYSGGWNIMFIALCECVSISYFYGKLVEMLTLKYKYKAKVLFVYLALKKGRIEQLCPSFILNI